MMGGEDPKYMARVWQLPCCAIGQRAATQCRGPIQAHHAGAHPGIGMKAHDHSCVPFCLGHHAEWHDHRGTFKGWRKQQRRDWADRQISATQARLHPGLDPDVDRRDEGLEIFPIARYP